MPGKVGVKIKAGRNLPVMDRGSDTTDAYVEIKLGSVTHKTDVCRKSLNPQWNTDWFRFEVDDAELQDEPLQIRLMDYDTYSANDAIGKVNISLNPLCLETSGQAMHGKGTVMSGWIPVFDTMHGIRGEVNIIVKVDLFSDLNKFRQSSCGVQFFHSPCIPHGYRAQIIHGFVEELVVNDDPEYQWIDKIRTPRASNEARQVVFLKLSGQVQRKMGLKAINMGANAVIGYTQCFDLEGDVGVVARGVGTAISLIKDTNSQTVSTDNALIEEHTLKYLEFLSGDSAHLPKLPDCRFLLRRARSSTLFELKHSTEIPVDDSIMLNLMRQEDERGEKVKKFRHHVCRFKSSKNMFHKKFSTLIRKISSSARSVISPINDTKSLESLFTSRLFIKGGVKTRQRRDFPKLKSTHQPVIGSCLTKNSRTLVRSLSDDAAVKHITIAKMAKSLYSAAAAVAIEEFQDSTRSSPNIPTEKSDACGLLNQNFLFGNFSQHKPHLIRKQSQTYSNEICSLKSSSSGSTSLTTLETSVWWRNSEKSQRLLESCSSTETVETTTKKPLMDQSELSKIENLINASSFEGENELLESIWMKPGCDESVDDSLSGPTIKHSVVHDLKELISATTNSLSLKPVKVAHEYVLGHVLPRIKENEIRSNSSAQLQKLAETKAPKPGSGLRLSRSLTNLSTCYLVPATLSLVSNVCCFPDFTPEPRPNCPILNICPSTPTETDNVSSSLPLTESFLHTTVDTESQFSGNIDLLQPSDLFANSKHLKIAPCRPPHYGAPLHQYYNASYTNISKTSLLVPSVSLSRINHHRSPNEISAGSTSAACSTKHLTSPASTAIMANGSGDASGSQTKLSLSPSRIGIPTTQCENSVSSPMASKENSDICRRSSDSDLSVTPKGNSICVASERLAAATALMRLNQPAVAASKTPAATDSAMDMLEYPFLTMTIYPPGLILNLGATVAARSVKLLERVPNPDEPEVRDSWWTELRMEIRSHARALGCNVVLGYSESTTISDDVCVLSATGTAAVINMAYNRSPSQADIFSKIPAAVGTSGSLEDRDHNGSHEATGSIKEISWQHDAGNTGNKRFGLPQQNILKNSCFTCHVPYNLTSVPFNVKMQKCRVCRKGRVPDVLMATLEVPEYLQITGRGCFMQAQVVRAKKDLRSELNAKEISDGLPFLEYELHRVLINKLKAKGMNAIFGLKAQVAIGERMIALIATGTALFLSALPIPQVPKIVAGNSWTDTQKLNDLQKKLQETFERNQEVYQLKCIDPDLVSASGGGVSDKQSDTDDSDEEVIEIDLNCGNKDTCVLEVDDIEDLEIISLLMESHPPEGFHVVNTQIVPGLLDIEAVKNLQMFTQVWRAKLDVGQIVSGFPKHFQRLLQTIYFKLRTMIPCAICDLKFRLDFPESDQIQLLVTGMAVGLDDVNKKIKCRRKTLASASTSNKKAAPTAASANQASDSTGSHGQKRTLQDEDYIFPLDEDQMADTPMPANPLSYGTHSLKLRKTSPSRASAAVTTKSHSTSFRNRYFPLRDRFGIDITPLSFLPGGRIEKYLGNLNFFFIRESTSIRENGGISGFVHSFITELLAVVRAHIAALGGNAMVSFYMTELILVDNQHKNQGQCLISVGGDAVYVSYFADD